MQQYSWGGTQQVLRQQALALSIKISSTQARLQILDEEYLQDKIQLSNLLSAMTSMNRQLDNERQKVKKLEYRLRQIAVSEYTNNAADPIGIMGDIPVGNIASEKYLYGSSRRAATRLANKLPNQV